MAMPETEVSEQTGPGGHRTGNSSGEGDPVMRSKVKVVAAQSWTKCIPIVIEMTNSRGNRKVTSNITTNSNPQTNKIQENNM